MSFFHDIEQSWPNVMDTRMRIGRQLWKEDVGRDKQGQGKEKDAGKRSWKEDVRNNENCI